MESKTLAERMSLLRNGPIAKAIGASGSAVSSWRNGNAFPAPEFWKPLAAILGIEVDLFFEMQRAFNEARKTAAA